MVQEIMSKDKDKLTPGKLGLSGEEKENLRKFSREEIGREATRALVILWYDEGKTEAEIAALLFISERTVRRCVQRYKEKNIEGLHDKEKSGRPRKADEKVEKAVEEAMKKSPEDVGYSSGYWIASILCIYIFTVLGVTLSNSTVRRVLCRLDYVFRRPKLWSGPSGENPPEIKKALEEVKKNKAILLYQDETSFHLLPVLRKMWIAAAKDGAQL
jgi:putative transposase